MDDGTKSKLHPCRRVKLIKFGHYYMVFFFFILGEFSPLGDKKKECSTTHPKDFCGKKIKIRRHPKLPDFEGKYSEIAILDNSFYFSL
jgi:hypothetical protein